jgi:hypothetical protein
MDNAAAVRRWFEEVWNRGRHRDRRIEAPDATIRAACDPSTFPRELGLPIAGPG